VRVWGIELGVRVSKWSGGTSWQVVMAGNRKGSGVRNCTRHGACADGLMGMTDEC